jgi:hypothetical protein
MCLAKGASRIRFCMPSHSDFFVHSILEYLNREDADRAVRDLDGKDLRGRPVRVALDDPVG